MVIVSTGITANPTIARHDRVDRASDGDDLHVRLLGLDLEERSALGDLVSNRDHHVQGSGLRDFEPHLGH